MRRSIPLTLFWFVHMGSLGIFFPYFSLYLKENTGLSGTQLGWILAIVPLVSIITQPLWAQVADRTSARSRLVAFLSVSSALRYLRRAEANGLVTIALSTFAVAVFVARVLH